MNQSFKKASVGSCTPHRMAQAGVPLDTALNFTRIRNVGPRTPCEFHVFNSVRSMVARAP
jgi:hypothetical protein